MKLTHRSQYPETKRKKFAENLGHYNKNRVMILGGTKGSRGMCGSMTQALSTAKPIDSMRGLQRCLYIERVCY